jgi:hypothetical protein
MGITAGMNSIGIRIHRGEAMDPRLSPALIVALVVPLVIMMAVAIVVELSQRRRDRADGVLISWDDLRLTRSHLIVGAGRAAQRFPLDGLSAKVTVTASPGQADDDSTVLLTIENAGHDICRSQPYSYGSSGGAQAFAIKFNLVSGHRRTAPESPHTAANVTIGHQAPRAA